MTDQDVAQLGPAFASFLRRFRPCFLQDRTAAHFDSYCQGLLSDLPRKSVEPIALASGTAVRTLQEFLTTADWDQELARDTLRVARAYVDEGSTYKRWRARAQGRPGPLLKRNCHITVIVESRPPKQKGASAGSARSRRAQGSKAAADNEDEEEEEEAEAS